jgi:hypothetical protein
MRLISVAAVMLMLAGCGEGTVPVKQGGPVEFLKVAPYPVDSAWKMITDKSDSDGWTREWIATDQNADRAKDVLTVQVFLHLRGKDSAEYLQGILLPTIKTCFRDHYTLGTIRDPQDPYLSFSDVQMYCTYPNGQHEEMGMFIMVISALDALYVVQHEFHYHAEEGQPHSGVTILSRGQGNAILAVMKEGDVTDRWLKDQVYVCLAAGDRPEGCTDGSPNIAARP